MRKLLSNLVVLKICLLGISPAKAVLIDATIVTDTATLFEAYVTDTAALGGSSFTITGVNWSIDVRKASLSGGGSDNDVQVFNAVHQVGPHAGEIAPYFIPQLASMIFTDVTAGLDASPIALGFGSAHPGGSDEDAVLARYEAFGPAGESRLSIRLVHGAPGQSLNEAITDVSEPGSLAVFGLGILGLGYMRRRKAA